MRRAKNSPRSALKDTWKNKIMPDLLNSIAQTRERAALILVKSLAGSENLSEKEVSAKILAEMAADPALFETGWYDPPPGGVGILFDQPPFRRLHYDSLRNPSYWPNAAQKFAEESTGLIYFSPVDRATGMLGDIGLTVYNGNNQKIKQHIKNCYEAILQIAGYAGPGMKFSDICAFAETHLQGKFKMTKWATISSNPNQSVNLGHTIPGSFGDSFPVGGPYEQVKEAIRQKRVHVIDTEHAQIPETCAFTIESRLEDSNDSSLPSVYFQFIVCLQDGQKTILGNFEQIFRAVGMDYMNGK